MRAPILMIGLFQAALVMACDRSQPRSEPARERANMADVAKSASPVALGRVGGRPASDTQASAQAGEIDPWSRPTASDAGSRLIVHRPSEH